MSTEFLSQVGRVIDQISKDKGINRDLVVQSVVQGTLAAVRKKYGTYRDIEVKFNEDEGELELFEFRKVVPDNEFEDELIEIKYSEAVGLDPDVEIEDQIGIRLELQDLGRIDAQAAKQTIIQHLRSAEHDIIYSEFEKRKGEVVSGIVRRVDPGMIVVDLDKTEAYIPRREQIPGEHYKSGDRIQGYLLEVRQTTKGPQIIMSRAHEKYLIKLFESEVPEIYEGIVKIVGAAREPGQRAKMAVYSTDPTVHPVGACVGVKGSRVQNITQELKGERIDIIVWEDSSISYVCNALAPAKIVKVIVDEDNQKMRLLVPDDQLSLAIGKKGQNVRLAVKLTGWNLDLISESEAEEKKQKALFNISLIPGMTETMAQGIYQYGFSSVQEVAQSSAEIIQEIPGYEDLKKAQGLIVSAKNLVREYQKAGKEFPEMPKKEEKKEIGNLKEQADEILKQELAQLEKGESQAEAVQEESSTQASTQDSPEHKEEESTQAQPEASKSLKEEAPLEKEEVQKASTQDSPEHKEEDSSSKDPHLESDQKKDINDGESQ